MIWIGECHSCSTTPSGDWCCDVNVPLLSPTSFKSDEGSSSLSQLDWLHDLSARCPIPFGVSPYRGAALRCSGLTVGPRPLNDNFQRGARTCTQMHRRAPTCSYLRNEFYEVFTSSPGLCSDPTRTYVALIGGVDLGHGDALFGHGNGYGWLAGARDGTPTTGAWFGPLAMVEPKWGHLQHHAAFRAGGRELLGARTWARRCTETSKLGLTYRTTGGSQPLLRQADLRLRSQG